MYVFQCPPCHSFGEGLNGRISQGQFSSYPRSAKRKKNTKLVWIFAGLDIYKLEKRFGNTGFLGKGKMIMGHSN